jgi:protein-disulfide isomerase
LRALVSFSRSLLNDIWSYPSPPPQPQAFLDLTCPDCQQAWPSLKEVASFYGQNIDFVVNPFPLPYHDNAFLAAQAVYAVQKQDTKAVFKWLDSVYASQDFLYNAATANMTKAQVVGVIADRVATLGVDRTQFVTDMNDVNLNGITRTTWKYACSLGVTGTPMFRVNGVPVQGDPTWTLAQWRFVLDDLLPTKPSQKIVLDQVTVRKPASLTQDITCPTGQAKCEYLPNTFECCLSGENCIKNVGCRC